MLLITLIRIAFVLLAVSVGHVYGSRYYQNAGVIDFPWWHGGMLGFGIAVTLIAAEHAFRRHFTRTLAGFLLGLGLGLLFSLLVIQVLHAVLQNQTLIDNLDIPLALVITYLVLVMVMHNVDRFRIVVPFVEFRSERLELGTAVVDCSALHDGRLLGLQQAGLLDNRLVVPHAVVSRAEALARSANEAERLRGTRALENLAELRDRLDSSLVIDDTDLPTSDQLEDVILTVVRLHSARLVCCDAEISSRARGEGLRVLDLEALARHLAPVLRPGDRVRVPIEKTGENPGQGVGFLDDGSMVVMGRAADAIGESVSGVILRIHHTSNGRMLFAERESAEDA
ncbi:MAG: hypothetical protein ACOCZK_07970 [Planctomycetota bacterium]